MKHSIQYTYQNFPNCPRATEYSRYAESQTAGMGYIAILLSFGAIITFVINTISFFGSYDWLKFVGGLAFIIAAASMDFYVYVIRPNNTSYDIKIILLEENCKDLPDINVQEYCELLKKENRETNIEDFLSIFPIFLFALFDSIALIAGIKGVYFLCHRTGGLILLVVSIIALCIFSFLIWLFINQPFTRSNSNKKKSGQSNKKISTTPNDNIVFCRKCGAKVLPDSKFCSECGEQIR